MSLIFFLQTRTSKGCFFIDIYIREMHRMNSGEKIRKLILLNGFSDGLDNFTNEIRCNFILTNHILIKAVYIHIKDLWSPQISISHRILHMSLSTLSYFFSPPLSPSLCNVFFYLIILVAAIINRYFLLRFFNKNQIKLPKFRWKTSLNCL